MNMDSLNKWLSLASNIGVIIGIVFLGVEMNQNSQLMRIQISQARSDAISANLNTFAASDYIPLISIKAYAGEELNSEELYRLQLALRSAHAQQENTFYQVTQGMLDDSALSGVRDFALQTALAEAPLSIWSFIQTAYSDEYRNYINDVIAEVE